MAESNLAKLWSAINKAGDTGAYIQEQLKNRGFLVARTDTSSMSKAKLKEYKIALKAEAAEKKQLKKDAWAAYKANHIVHLGEGVFWNDAADFDQFDLPNAEKRAAENELPQLEKPEHLAKALGIDIPELRWLTYHRDVAEKIHYRRFTIPKRDGSDRAIWAPLPKLKAAQKWVHKQILDNIPVHGSAHGFLPGRSTYSNAKVHTDSKIVLRMDIRNFFPTITLPRVKGVFRKAGYREQIATLLALLCTEAPREIVEHEGKKLFVALDMRCLPQGAPTSPAITNVLCMKMDRRMAGLAKKFGWRYTRYADDLTFSLPEAHQGEPKLGALLGSVGRVIEDEGFQVHHKKTWIARKGNKQQITGLVINGDGTPRVPRELKRNIRAAIHNAKQGKPFKNGETLQQIQGYVSYIAMSDPELGKKLSKELSEATKI